jgi:hypothetical protein
MKKVIQKIRIQNATPKERIVLKEKHIIKNLSFQPLVVMENTLMNLYKKEELVN